MNLPPMTDGPRKPTPEQLLRIRQELDGHYDESRRCYLERQTDKTLAERCGVPWAWVRDLREVAYGPLEADSELVEIREEMRRLDDAYGELGNRLETALKRLQAAEERLSR